ncbi:hypothetical protein ACTD5D_00305 [Nocardia takedensis]|uniref:hypothetical protein n=1 Tax=Nocardia takedensis TaxID=259390 RepID=UPI003F75CF44
MSLPDLSAREHQVAADECEVLATYLEQLADLVDGEMAVPLARAHRSTAAAMRARAARHREHAERKSAECNDNAVPISALDALPVRSRWSE